MSALLRSLGRRNLTDTDAAVRILPVNQGPRQCDTCWVLPGVTHELSCPKVPLERVEAYFAHMHDRDVEWERRDRRWARVACRLLVIVAATSATLIAVWLR